MTNVNVRNLGGRRPTLKTRPQPKARGARRKRKDGGPEAVEVPGVTLGHAGMTNSTESSEREKDGRTLCEGTPPYRREHPERGGKKGCGNVKLDGQTKTVRAGADDPHTVRKISRSSYLRNDV